MMDINRIITGAVGLSLIFNGYGLNRLVGSKKEIIDNVCTKYNLHIGLNSVVITGALLTYKSLRNL